MKKILFGTLLSIFFSLNAQAIKFIVELHEDLRKDKIEFGVTRHRCAHTHSPGNCACPERNNEEFTYPLILLNKALSTHTFMFLDQLPSIRKELNPDEAWDFMFYVQYRNRTYFSPKSFKLPPEMNPMEEFEIERQTITFNGSLCEAQ